MFKHASLFGVCFSIIVIKVKSTFEWKAQLSINLKAVYQIKVKAYN